MIISFYLIAKQKQRFDFLLVRRIFYKPEAPIMHLYVLVVYFLITNEKHKNDNYTASPNSSDTTINQSRSLRLVT